MIADVDYFVQTLKTATSVDRGYIMALELIDHLEDGGELPEGWAAKAINDAASESFAFGVRLGVLSASALAQGVPGVHGQVCLSLDDSRIRCDALDHAFLTCAFDGCGGDAEFAADGIVCCLSHYDRITTQREAVVSYLRGKK